MDCSPRGSSAHGILQARILEWVAIPFSGGSSWPRSRTQISSIAGRFFTVWATREGPDCALMKCSPRVLIPQRLRAEMHEAHRHHWKRGKGWATPGDVLPKPSPLTCVETRRGRQLSVEFLELRGKKPWLTDCFHISKDFSGLCQKHFMQTHITAWGFWCSHRWIFVCRKDCFGFRLGCKILPFVTSECWPLMSDYISGITLRAYIYYLI